jgi:hypothetical protein
MLLPLRGRSWVADAAAYVYVYVLFCCFSCHVSQPMLRTELILNSKPPTADVGGCGYLPSDSW